MMIDLKGKRVGKLEVIKEIEPHVSEKGRKRRKWECLCDCGNTVNVIQDILTAEKQKSCGCLRTEAMRKIGMEKRKDYTGYRFGRLVVLKESKTYKNTRSWTCKCDCGNIKNAKQPHLKSGYTKSCGCLKKETKPNVKHGLTNSSEYRIWRNMLNRCSLAELKGYEHYGGRGIKVCKRWLKFENFYKDIGKRPSKKHSIERIDNDGDYCPENCIWATKKTQARNKRNTRKVLFNGEEIPLITLCEKKKVPYKRVWHRYMKLGLSIEESINPKLMWES